MIESAITNYLLTTGGSTTIVFGGGFFFLFVVFLNWAVCRFVCFGFGGGFSSYSCGITVAGGSTGG
jgi:hypothetical protein